jgi:AraC-like DNA-binding protein
MAERPEFLSDAPHGGACQSMDALSDLLKAIRLTGGVYLAGELSAPWCIQSQVSADECRKVQSRPENVVGFHYVLEGRMLLQVEGASPVQAGPESVVLVTRNERHVLASEPGLRPFRAADHTVIDPEDGVARLRYDGGGERTRIVCGYVGTENRRHPLFEALPRTLVLELRDSPGSEWLATSFRYAARSLARLEPGAALSIARLSELMFIEAIRRYLCALPPGQAGWLAGLRDPSVGRALALLHSQFDRPWTTEGLAREVALSRSAFADRFTSLIGTPPMSYLTAWRMQVAQQRLRETQLSVAQVAAEVGYESEASFTRAFSRELGMPPARWRREQPGVDQAR